MDRKDFLLIMVVLILLCGAICTYVLWANEPQPIASDSMSSSITAYRMKAEAEWGTKDMAVPYEWETADYGGPYIETPDYHLDVANIDRVGVMEYAGCIIQHAGGDSFSATIYGSGSTSHSTSGSMSAEGNSSSSSSSSVSLP